MGRFNTEINVIILIALSLKCVGGSDDYHSDLRLQFANCNLIENPVKISLMLSQLKILIFILIKTEITYRSHNVPPFHNLYNNTINRKPH